MGLKYLDHAEACSYVYQEAGLSRTSFDRNIRPGLLEREFSDRVKRYKRQAIDAILHDPTYQEEGSMRLRKPTVESALEECWDAVWRLQTSADSQRSQINQIISEIGGVTLKELSGKKGFGILQGWVKGLRKTEWARGKFYSEATIHRRLTSLTKALNMACSLGQMDELPKLPEVVVKNEKDRYLSRDEARKILEVSKHYGSDLSKEIMPHAIAFLLQTGCRRSEMIKVRPEDVHPDGVVFNDRKTGGSLKVPLGAEARRGINYLLLHPWWQYKRAGQISKWFDKIADGAGVGGVCLHTLRHTCGTWLSRGGMPIDRVQKWMGHRDIQTTLRRYVHLRTEDLAGGVNIMELREKDNVIPFENLRILD